MRIGQFRDADTGTVAIPHVEVADTYWSRLQGLQFRRQLAPGHALWIIPCSSIHTFFVRFDLDLLMLDREGRVLSIRRRLRPWRLAFTVSGTHSIVELTADSALDLEGQRLRFESNDASARENP